MNPIKAFRSQHELTQLGLAQEVGITRQVITNLESGLLLSLPSELASYISPTNPAGPQAAYQAWVYTKRLQNRPYFTNSNIRFNQGWNSFKFSVQPNRSHRGFCRKLVYQPSALELFEHTVRSTPPSLITALSDVGLTHDQIFNLLGINGVTSEFIKRSLLQSGRVETAPRGA